MTDNEIKKALECCQGNADCANCPYYENNHHQCGDNFNKDVLDLINRQQAEINRLHKEVEYWEAETKEARADIDQAVAEAIKEFAERVCKDLSQCQREYRNVLNSDGACAMIIAKKVVNTIKKEMVGVAE